MLKFLRLERISYILNIAVEAVFLNKFRSILTALGIIFGVAAVIAMMAIGNGAKKEILDQIKLVGVNNIVISPIIEKAGKQKDENESEKDVKKKFSPGLTLKDALGIGEVLPTVSKVSPEVIFETFIIKDGIRSPAKLDGVTPDFFEVFNLKISEGQMFNQEQLEMGKPVCIIGPNIKSKFFPKENAVGQFIKCGNVWLQVIGVLENRDVTQNASENLGINEYNKNIFAPLQTVLLRFKDRSLVTSSSIQGGGTVFAGGDIMIFGGAEGGEEENNFNQIDKIVVQVKESKDLQASTEVIRRMLKRRHNDLEDFEIKVPELLLKQEQRTKDIFNIVLGAIASISLIVGGIGIMNIMLASVMERIREIGVRMALGATKKDVILQFISEATIISVTGGVIGVVLGLVLSQVIMKVTGILTIVSWLSILVSFGVSAAVGILFGYMPAKKAAMQDPVTSLRHE